VTVKKVLSPEPTTSPSGEPGSLTPEELAVLDPPGYWMNESTGVLKPAIEAYLKGELLTHGQIAAIRSYLRQWMTGPWHGDVEALRTSIDSLTTRAAIHDWLTRALEAGIDPL
jgi:hypothetical protein